ncbi:MAG: serine hydrolase domain-containing protein [Myxococcota bacterium]
MSDPIPAEALAALYARAEETAARSDCAVQVAVGLRGALAGFRTFGRAPHGDGVRPATDETLFAVYSVTKAITSSAAWILLQEGKLSLSDRVVEHVPEFGANGKEAVTVEHLLLHTGGFPTAGLPTADWPDPSKRLAQFARWRLEWEPGSRFVYHGSSGMWVLAEIIGRLSGMDYTEFIRARISEPLGLSDLYVGLPAAENLRAAEVVMVGEVATEAERAASPVDAPLIDEDTLGHVNLPSNRSIGSPGGGAFATAAAIAMFYQGLLADADGSGAGIWQRQMLLDAWTPRHTELIDPMTQQLALRGLGVVVAGDHQKMWRGFAEACSPRSFGHMGAGGQIAWADPESGLSFAFCTNGAERDAMRQGANGFRLSSLAAACTAPERRS